MSKNKRLSTALVWYHRSEELPHEGNRIIIFSSVSSSNDEFMKLRVIDSQFYKIAKDSDWWAYVITPDKLIK